MGLKRIVAVSAISQGLLWKLIYGKRRPDGTRVPSQRIRPATQAAILAIRLDLAGGARVDSVGTKRRLQALVAIGWSQSKLATRLGILPSNFGPLIHERTTVTVTHAKAVTALYDQLWDQVPPHEEWRDHIAYTRALNYATSYDWFVPLAWDEDDLDNPDAQPDRGQTEQSLGRPSTYHVDDIEWLADECLSVDGIAARLGVGPGAIEYACRHADRLDLLDRIQPRTNGKARAS